MAFKTPTPELAARAIEALPAGVAYLQEQHNTATKKLLAAADAAAGPVDTAAILAAIRAYRETMDPVDPVERKKSPRATVLHLAMHLIGAGLAPGTVCTGLGYGRTAMNAAMAADGKFRTLIEPGTRPTRKAVA